MFYGSWECRDPTVGTPAPLSTSLDHDGRLQALHVGAIEETEDGWSPNYI